MALPVTGALHDAVRLGKGVVRRHYRWLAVAWALLAFLAMAAGSLGPWVTGVSFAAVIAAIAVLTHREILRGPTTIEEAVAAGDRWRLAEYLFDAGIILLTLLPFAFAAAFAIVHTVQGTAVLLVVACGLLAWLPLGVRLMLKLPSRAVGDGLAWRAVWRLGRGNTMPMAAATLLLHAAFLAVLFFVWVIVRSAGASPLTSAIVLNVPPIAETVFGTALVAAFYLRLTVGGAAIR